MSVAQGERTDGKLKVLVLAMELTTYTLQITKNQKVFKPEYNTAITNDIIHAAKQIFSLAWRANNIRVVDPSDPDGESGFPSIKQASEVLGRTHHRGADVPKKLANRRQETL